MDPIDRNEQRLYRLEYSEPDDPAVYVNWLWLKDEEVFDAVASAIRYREATADETDLYEEAYADGYGVAALMEFTDTWNGVTFRMELNNDDSDQPDFTTTKMFQCSMCDKHKDFDTQVATASGFYLTEIINDVLWHVCYDCAMLQLEVDGITLEFTQESEEGS